MKTLFKSILLIASAVFALTACEDIASPYPNPLEQTGTNETPKGDGTAADPFNPTAANLYIKENLASGKESDKDIYVKGIVTLVTDVSTSNGNITFYMSEDGKRTSEQFYVYRAKGLNNTNISSESDIVTGDEVVICGRVVNYNGTYETQQGKAYVYSKNSAGGTGSTDKPGKSSEPKGDGTQANPYNAAAANAYVKTLAADAESDKDIFISGKICEIKENSTTTYGNATFYISDDGTTGGEKFYVFRCYGPDNKKFTVNNALNVGDDVVVCGKVVNFKGNTPETVQNKAYIFSLKGAGGSTPGDDKPDTPDTPTDVTGDLVIDLSTFGLGNAAAVTTLEKDGVTLTFGAGTNKKSSPAYYTATGGVRMYANNTLNVAAAKNIAKVTMLCDSYNGTDYVGNPTLSATPGTVSVSGLQVSVGGINSKSVLIENTYTESTGGGTQLRVKTIAIEYAK